MEQSRFYKEFDDFEQAILNSVGISRDQYRKSYMKEFSVHYLEFNWQLKDGPTILLLHGYGGSGVSFYRIIPSNTN